MGISSIKIPDVGEGVAEVELVEWHVKVGDIVKEDDILAAVMTDKATVEIPCLFDGKILSLGGALGDTLVVGAELLTIEHDSKSSGAVEAKIDVASIDTPEEDVTPPGKPASESTPKPASQPDPTRKAPSVGNARAPRPEGQPLLAAPSVRARAREAGIDLRKVVGSGPAGRIVNSDLDAVFDAGSAPKTTTSRRREGSEDIRIIGLRRKIADRMSLANTRIPHITVIEEIDVTTLEDLRATMNASRGDKPKLTVLPFVSAALCRTVD
jgi:2-oxoisovalerate dehydrogenase E2 component (dihydrolipoyl transacylase)